VLRPRKGLSVAAAAWLLAAVVKVIDWWGRADLVLGKVREVAPTLVPSATFLFSGKGEVTLLVIGFGWIGVMLYRAGQLPVTNGLTPQERKRLAKFRWDLGLVVQSAAAVLEADNHANGGPVDRQDEGGWFNSESIVDNRMTELLNQVLLPERIRLRIANPLASAGPDVPKRGNHTERFNARYHALATRYRAMCDLLVEADEELREPPER
jgi:hypothetical protein